MRGRTTLTILFFSGAMLIPQSSDAYTIVRKDGTKFEAQAAPEYKDGKAIFKLPGGSTGSMAEGDVNKAATEKLNAAPAAAKPDAKNKPVVTNDTLNKAPEGPGAKNPGGKSKASFTNEDLGKAEGSGTVEGSVSTGDAASSGAAPGETEEDWAKRHDEEMKRLAEERASGTDGGNTAKDAAAREKSAADKAKQDADASGGEGGNNGGLNLPGMGKPGGAPGGAAEPPKDETDEEKAARLEKERDELREKLNTIDTKIGGGAGDATTVNERLQTVEDLNKKEEELEEAKGGDE